jgi:hypothetical protein
VSRDPYGPRRRSTGKIQAVAATTGPAAETLVRCDLCGGHGMVTPRKREEWRGKCPDLVDATPESKR